MKRRTFLQHAGAAGLASTIGGLWGASCQKQEVEVRPSYNFELGCFNRPWVGAPFEDMLSAIQGAGFQYCGFLSLEKGVLPIGVDDPQADVARIKPLLESRNLQLKMIMITHDLKIPANELMSKLIPQIEAAKSLGVRHILTVGTSSMELFDAFIELMKMLADEMLKREMLILMKPHGGISATGAQCVEVVEKVNSEAFRICYDPGNIIYYTNTDPAKDVSDVAHYVKAMCIKDCIGSEVTKNGNVNVTPGNGKVDFKTVFDVLKKSAFSGPALIETLGGKTPAENNEESKKAHEYLKQFVV